MRGENIHYTYTNSKHKNPLCRVIPVQIHEKEATLTLYDREKYCDLLFVVAETVLGYFGFDSNDYRRSEDREKDNKNKKWWDELRQERTSKLKETIEVIMLAGC